MDNTGFSYKIRTFVNQSYYVYQYVENSMKHITFILNPISGTVSKSGIPALIDKYLDKSKYTYSIEKTEYAGHGTELARQAAFRGDDIVVAIGGDGTVNEVGKALIHTDTALGVLPCGSGNGLARHLMIPMDPVRAIEVLNEGEIHDLDYGTINAMPFFCTCGMGFDAFISMKFAEAGKRGPITYVQKVLEEGLRYKPETYEIIDKDGSSHYKAFLISVANASQYGNNAFIAPQASMSDGQLDVIIMEPFDVLEAPQVALELFNKTLDKNTKIKTFKTERIVIHRSEPGLIHFDGDPTMTGADVEIDVHKDGIKIVVNKNANKSSRQPSALQNAFSEFFYDIDSLRSTIVAQSKRLQEVIRHSLPI